RNPSLALVVVIDSAKGPNGDHGGMVAAPIFKRIAESALRYVGIPPTVNPAPPVLVARRDEAAGSSPSLARTAGSAASTEQPVVRLVVKEPGTMPDVRGLGARQAVRKLAALGLSARVSGNGVVVSQLPLPGEPVEPGGLCRLTLERAPARRPADPVHP